MTKEPQEQIAIKGLISTIEEERKNWFLIMSFSVGIVGLPNVGKINFI